MLEALRRVASEMRKPASVSKMQSTASDTKVRRQTFLAHHIRKEKCDAKNHVQDIRNRGRAIFAAVTSAESAKGVTGREGFCAGEHNYNVCVNADRGSKKSQYRAEAYESCSELAEYVSRTERREWERCLAREDRAIKGAPGDSL